MSIDIRVSGISMVYCSNRNKITALEHVSFEVARGTLLCIVGPSGCGKSTLLRALLGLLIPTTGSVWLDEERKRNGIAYVQQMPQLLPWRTLLQNAVLGTEIKGNISPARIEAVKDEIKGYGLEGREDNIASELSGGELQRVAIIRALESRPSLLFCDEPFSAIDFVTRLELSTRFKKMCRLHNITTVFVTHNIEEAIFLADEVLVMSGSPGRIIAKYHPRLSLNSQDAVKCRESPEFSQYFTQIWDNLRGNFNGF